VPPIPPHATLDQIEKSAEAMFKGDEDRWGVLKEGIRTKAQEILH
jgi:pyruvate dehydrogenase (quinone)